MSAPAVSAPAAARRLLIVYSTTDGHALEIAGRIAAMLRGRGLHVDLVDVRVVAPDVPAQYDAVIVGASIRYGHHSPAVHDFVERQAEVLAARPNAFFSVNAVARKPHKRGADSNPYVRKFLRRIRWRPQLVEVFAGKIDYPRYGAFDRNVIRLIMWLTGGPTDPRSVTDFTDWRQVEDFAGRVAELVG